LFLLLRETRALCGFVVDCQAYFFHRTSTTKTKEEYPMLKAGIFLDVENLSRNGGWGIRYEVIKELVAAQGEMTVLRANAYLAVDVER